MTVPESPTRPDDLGLGAPVTLPLPRMAPGLPPSARAWNTVCSEVDSLGTVFRIARTRSTFQEGQATEPGLEYVVHWDGPPTATRSDMWSPAFPQQVVIREPGVYLMVFQCRWNTGNTVGRRSNGILLNGTSPVVDSIARDSRPAINNGEGPTVRVWAVRALVPDDVIYCSWRSTHASGSVTTLLTDHGGTYLSVSRLGPGGGF